MAYTAVPATEITRLNLAYKTQTQKVNAEKRSGYKLLLVEEQTRIGNQVRDQLNDDIAAIEQHNIQHRKARTDTLAAATRKLAAAKKMVEKYKKDTSKVALVPQLEDAVNDLTDLETTLRDDAHDYGEAWRGYRANVVKDVPDDIKADFERRRQTIINGDKETSVALQKLAAMKLEAEALQDVTSKASMKTAIKAMGTGAQRDIKVARTKATEIAQQLAGLLDKLRDPEGRVPKPNAITSGKDSLVASSTNPNFITQKNALRTAQGFWDNVDTAYQLMNSKAANMEKVLATRTKGFRSTELKDPTVKAELVKAAKSVTDAKKDIKDKVKDYEAAKKAIAKIEAAAKRQGIR